MLHFVHLYSLLLNIVLLVYFYYLHSITQYIELCSSSKFFKFISFKRNNDISYTVTYFEIYNEVL